MWFSSADVTHIVVALVWEKLGVCNKQYRRRGGKQPVLPTWNIFNILKVDIFWQIFAPKKGEHILENKQEIFLKFATTEPIFSPSNLWSWQHYKGKQLLVNVRMVDREKKQTFGAATFILILIHD